MCKAGIFFHFINGDFFFKFKIYAQMTHAFKKIFNMSYKYLHNVAHWFYSFIKFLSNI